MIKNPIGNLPRGIKVDQTLRGKKKYWRVRLGKKFCGRRGYPPKYYTSLQEARDYVFGDAQKEKNQTGSLQNLKDICGSTAFELSPTQINDSIAAHKLLNGKSLIDAVEFYIKHSSPCGKKMTFEEVAVLFLKERERIMVKNTTLKQYKSQLKVASLELGKETFSLIKKADIEDWIEELPVISRTKNNYLTTLSTLFLFGRDNKYCYENPTENIKRSIIDDKEIGILNVDQTIRLLKNCLEEDIGMLCFICLGAFAGIRRSEICKLEWANIDLEENEIEIKPAVSKTRSRRIIKIEENLREWLLYCPRGEYPAISKNVDVCGEHLKKLVDENKSITPFRERLLPKWPQNALRHSYGSYHLSHFNDEGLTSRNMGNSPSVIFKNYRSIVKSSATKAYWNITPSSIWTP